MDKMNTYSAAVILYILFVLNIRQQSLACSPGPSSKGPSHHPRVSTPLTLKQRVPDVSEQTLGASGASEGRIVRGTPRFDELLVKNTNSDIQFKDEEGTGADRLMTQRCKDKVNTLAISVMNYWPGVQLRVIEAWDEGDGLHEENSLHYEGRAVEITTSDRDKSKYGQLARMAVDAGFDWVSYASRNYVHCSVRSESSAAATDGGCFYVGSNVILESGEQKPMGDVEIGDRILVVKRDGTVDFSEVLLLMDQRPLQDTLFNVIHTRDPSYKLSLTPEHLVYMSVTNSSFEDSQAVFASDVKEGQYVYTFRQTGDLWKVVPTLVTRVNLEEYTGAVAPLTREGSIIVDGVAASSYAVIRDEWIAHFAFAPVRWLNLLPSIGWSETENIDSKPEDGQPYLHWYPRLLYKYGSYIVNKRFYEGFVLPD